MKLKGNDFMYKCFEKYDYLFANKDNCLLEEAVKSIFKGIKSGDKMSLHDYTKVNIPFRDNLVINIQYNKRDEKDFYNTAKNLIESIKEIASFADKNGVIEDFNNIKANNGLLSVFTDYISPLKTDTDDNDDIKKLHEKWLESASFEDFDAFEINKAAGVFSNLKTVAESRIGESPYAFETIIFAQRLCRLYTLNTPACVIHAEQINLIMALFVHKFAVRTERTA